MTVDLFDKRSILFLPASNPRAIAKARGSEADLVVLDLEDAVKPADKEAARVAAVAAVGEAWPMPVAIRVNGTASKWHGEDVSSVAASQADFVIVPRVSAASEIEAVSAAVRRPVAAMIETAAGVLAAPSVAKVAAALIAGTNDLSSDLRLPAIDRSALSYALQSILVAARAEGIPAFDGVFNRLEDEAGFAAECADSRRLGFDGKSLIHPDQIAACHAAFAPSANEIARATRLVAAASGGAERFEGEMVEAMHVAAARRLLVRANR